MIPPRVLIVDCNAVCYSAYFMAGGLTYDGADTGIIYSFFSQIFHACKAVRAAHMAFCWDSFQSRRKLLFPAYKSNRDKSDPQLLRAFQQFRRLRKEILPRLNFSNVFHVNGFEADDLIASLCLRDAPRDEQHYYIMSGDHDLYQLLTPQVSMFKIGAGRRKGRIYTLHDFQGEHGLPPIFWPEVKAIAGCASDALPGIRGVGEKTAIQYLRNSCTGKRHALIESAEGKRTRLRNLPLVRLPLERMPELRFDWSGRPSFAEWICVCEELGFESFLRRLTDWEGLFAGITPQALLQSKVRIGKFGKGAGHE